MKYVNLHEHLGGSTSAATLYQIAVRRGMNLGFKLDNAYYTFKELIDGKHDVGMNHQKYLDKFDLTESIQSSIFAIEQSVKDVIMNAFLHQNINRIELRFNPMLRNSNGLYDIDRLIEAACTEMNKITGMFPIKAGIIICTDWRFSFDKSIMLAEKAVKYSNMGVVGFDVAGPYVKSMNIEDHRKALNIAHNGGLGTTIHCGEINDYHEIQHVLKGFVPDRFGHGITIVGHDYLMDKARDHGIFFEICPSSLIKTGAVDNLFELARYLRIFDEKGLLYSLNPDGSVFLNTTIENEYKKMKEVMNWTDDYIDLLNTNAMKHSFIKD